MSCRTEQDARFRWQTPGNQTDDRLFATVSRQVVDVPTAGLQVAIKNSSPEGLMYVYELAQATLSEFTNPESPADN